MAAKGRVIFSAEQLAPHVWPFFWRFALISSAASIAIAFVASAVVGFFWTMYVRNSGLSPLLIAFPPFGVQLVQGAISWIASLTAWYYALKWVLQQRLGDQIAGTALLLVTLPPSPQDRSAPADKEHVRVD